MVLSEEGKVQLIDPTCEQVNIILKALQDGASENVPIEEAKSEELLIHTSLANSDTGMI